MSDHPQAIHELIDSDSGLFEIVTFSGAHHHLDLDGSTFRRVTTGLAQPLPRDGETTDLIAVVRCEVAARMELVIDLHVPNVD